MARIESGANVNAAFSAWRFCDNVWESMRAFILSKSVIVSLARRCSEMEEMARITQREMIYSFNLFSILVLILELPLFSS